MAVVLIVAYKICIVNTMFHKCVNICRKFVFLDNEVHSLLDRNLGNKLRDLSRKYWTLFCNLEPRSAIVKNRYSPFRGDLHDYPH